MAVARCACAVIPDQGYAIFNALRSSGVLSNLSYSEFLHSFLIDAFRRRLPESPCATVPSRHRSVAGPAPPPGCRLPHGGLRVSNSLPCDFFCFPLPPYMKTSFHALLTVSYWPGVPQMRSPSSPVQLTPACAMISSKRLCVPRLSTKAAVWSCSTHSLPVTRSSSSAFLPNTTRQVCV